MTIQAKERSDKSRSLIFNYFKELSALEAFISHSLLLSVTSVHTNYQLMPLIAAWKNFYFVLALLLVSSGLAKKQVMIF